MNRYELRKRADYLWDGEVEVVKILGQLQRFKRFDEMIAWLCDNQITGKKLINFFNDAEGEETRGVIRGVKLIYNYLDNDKFNKEQLTVKDLV